MNEPAFDVVKWVEEERKRVMRNPPVPQPPRERPTIHWTELKEEVSGRAGATDWNHYVKQVGRLLAEGHEGRWVLIVGGEIIDIYDTYEAAYQVRNERFPRQHVLIHQILEREPILRGGGYHRLWRV
jgi:hypothetical protein